MRLKERDFFFGKGHHDAVLFLDGCFAPESANWLDFGRAVFPWFTELSKTNLGGIIGSAKSGTGCPCSHHHFRMLTAESSFQVLVLNPGHLVPRSGVCFLGC